MARRPGDVDRASRLAPLADYLERYGFVPVRDAMVLYGTKRRDEVLAVRRGRTRAQSGSRAVRHGQVDAGEHRSRRLEAEPRVRRQAREASCIFHKPGGADRARFVREAQRRARPQNPAHTGLHGLRLRGYSQRRPRPDRLLRPQAAHSTMLERTASSMLCPAAGQRSERKMVLPRPRRYPRLFPRTGTHKVQSPHKTEPWQVLARTMVRARTRGPAHPSPHLRQPRTSPRRKRPRPPIQIRTRIRTPVLSCPSGRSWRRPQRGHARSAWAEEPSRGLPTISEQTRTLQCAAGATRTMRRMIAPSCSSLGPEPLICLLLGGCLQHSATPPQSTIKQ